ncbi:MAG: winged helix-turn-helix transcriptional regulator [Staphylothermus sp.]|nr:winged helix-turn-helix transcriptional regulator [Staphylothermus sp.]
MTSISAFGIFYSPKSTYTYRFNCNGYADVTITFTNLTNFYSIPVYIDKYTLPDTIIVADDKGNLLPFEFINETMLLVYTYNETSTVIVSYTLNNFSIRNYVYEAIITPYTQSSIVLPKEAGLIYFNGSAEVSVYDDSITLRYNEPGTYLIEYICETTQAFTTTTPSEPYTDANTNPLFNTYHLLWIITGTILVSVSIYLLSRRKRRVEAIITTTEVDERDIEILKALLEGQETISGLAKKLGISKSIVWRRVNKLADQGFIEKKTLRGKTLLNLTEKGRELIEKKEKK